MQFIRSIDQFVNKNSDRCHEFQGKHFVLMNEMKTNQIRKKLRIVANQLQKKTKNDHPVQWTSLIIIIQWNLSPGIHENVAKEQKFSVLSDRSIDVVLMNETNNYRMVSNVH